MARHRRLHFLVRRTTPACRIHRWKQRKREPIPTRTPALHRHRGNETSTPHWLRGDETESYRRHQVQPNHPKHVREPTGVKYRKFAEHTPATTTTTPTVLQNPPDKCTAMHPSQP